MKEEPKRTIRDWVAAVFLGQGLATIVLIVLGGSAAILLLLFLGRVSGTTSNLGETAVKGRDTVYVKLLDTMFSRNVMPFQSQENTTNDPGFVRPRNNANRPADSVRGNLFASPVTSKAKPILPSDLQKANNAGTVDISFWRWFFLPLLLAIVGLWAFSSYKGLPSPNFKRDVDKDPEELTVLFGRHLQAIESLGNPRKIKRFSNKVRFQYHYLENKHLFDGLSEHSRQLELDILLRTLLFIEKNLSKMNLELLSEEEKRNPVQWLKMLIKKEVSIDLPDCLAKPLLQLNKNVIA